MIAQTGFIPRGHNAVALRVTSYHERCLKGILSGALLEGEQSFRSTIEFLRRLESLMDQARFPQRNEETRVFRPALQPAGEEERIAADGKLPVIASFQISVIFRQNATWQGSLFWVDRGMEAHFRSVLELLNLIDSALSVEAGEIA